MCPDWQNSQRAALWRRTRVSWWTKKLDMSQQHELVWAAWRPTVSWPCSPQKRGGSREGIVLWSALVRPHLQYYIQVGGPQHREGMELFEWVLGRPWRPREGWSTSCEYRLRELGLFSLEKRRLWGDILAAFQCLKGAYKQEVEQLFTQSDSDKTRWNGFILKGEI